MNVFCALNSERFNNPQKNLVCTYFSGFNSFELDLSGEAICGGGKLKFDIKNMKMSIFFIYPFPSLGGTSPPPHMFIVLKARNLELQLIRKKMPKEFSKNLFFPRLNPRDQ
jgi:hypothetical protein